MSWIEITKTAEFASHLGVSEEVLKLARRQRSFIYIKKRILIGKKLKPRDICYPPDGSALKVVQNAVKEKCLVDIPLDESVRGYLKGQHNINVSQVMAGKRFVAKIDIKAFHPNITPELVGKALRRKGLSQMLCRVIAQLVTFEKAVPQGASTSNHMANIVVDYVFAQGILAFCHARDCVVVNFGDDTAIGGACRAKVNECVEFAKQVFAANGLQANSKSSDAEHLGAARRFIGTCTARPKADLPRSKFRQYRAELRAAVRAEKVEKMCVVTDDTMIRSLRSKITYTRRLNVRKARTLRNIFYRLFRIMRDKEKARKALFQMVPEPPAPITRLDPSKECPFEVAAS
jgi:hypothetical protein